MPLFTPNIEHPILVVYILIAVMHIVSGLSLQDCDQFLFSLHFLIELMVEDFCTARGQGRFLAKSVPMDTQTVVKWLALKPSYKTFVSCPECSTWYPDNGPDSYPKLCASKRVLSQEICGQHLQKACTVHTHHYNLPIRHFLYHNFKEWLGEMLCVTLQWVCYLLLCYLLL
jgi:hypothetical protein